MNSKILIILSIIILAVVLATGFFLRNSSSSINLKGNMGTTPTLSQVTTKASTVTVTASGFDPKNLTVENGEQVIWINKSGKTVSVNSDVYPTNLLWKFLNLGSFDNNQSVSALFEKSGKYTYHNQFDPSQTGSVTVN